MSGSSGSGGSLFGPVTESPFGIASSASSGYNPQNWLPQMAAAGITWLRGIQNSEALAKLDIADKNGIKVAGILYYSKDKPAAFPADDLTGWSAYITDLLTTTKGRVHHWEVWNEPPNFSDDKSPVSYGTIVASAHGAAKAVDPTVQVGLAAQSVNVNFLDQAIKAGAKGHFDYVTVHPYEVLDLVSDGWEAQFMSIVPTLHKMLAAQDPDRASAPVWFTEIGTPVQGDVTPAKQAEVVIKAYTMGIAQGATRIHWFEGIDGDSGPFGLLDGKGQPRPSYTAMKTLITQLGALPAYQGWVLLSGQHYGFVFNGPAGPVLVAWAQPKTTVEVSFAGAKVQVIDPSTGQATESTSLSLTNAPRIVAGIPASLVSEALANHGKPFPWGGDFSQATSISYVPGNPQGLHPFGSETLVTIDGDKVRSVADRPALPFTVDPNFLSYTTVPITITAEVRRNAGSKSAGFNLKYESVSGTKSTGSWNGVPSADTWTTLTWTITDAQFVGKWGYHFTFDSDSTQNSNYSIRKVTVAKP